MVISPCNECGKPVYYQDPEWSLFPFKVRCSGCLPPVKLSAEQAVIDKYTSRPGERLVRLVAPGKYADGRLLRQVFNKKTDAWEDYPIPRPW